MSNTMTAFLALGIVGGLGFILIITAILIKTCSRRKISKCTECTEGKIVGYRYPGEGMVKPVVEYVVYDKTLCCDKTYRTTKKYNGFKITRYAALMEPSISEDEKGYLHIKMGPIANIKKIANEKWPMGSTVKVYYSANNPNVNYVDRPISNRFLFIMFLFAGILCIVWGLFLFFVIR